MKASEKIGTISGDPVILSNHPAVKVSLKIKSMQGKLKAGTILKSGDAGLEVCGTGDTPACVLVEDVDTGGVGAEIAASCILHGCVSIRDLIDASGGVGSTAPAKEELYKKLNAAGIYPLQMF